MIFFLYFSSMSAVSASWTRVTATAVGPGTIRTMLAPECGQGSLIRGENHLIYLFWPFLGISVCCGAPPAVGCAVPSGADSRVRICFPVCPHILTRPSLPLHNLSHRLLKRALRPSERWLFYLIYTLQSRALYRVMPPRCAGAGAGAASKKSGKKGADCSSVLGL